MTHFKPAVTDYNEIDGELEQITERLSKIVEKLGLTFGQRYATMLVKSTFHINKTRIGIKEKMEIEAIRCDPD